MVLRQPFLLSQVWGPLADGSLGSSSSWFSCVCFQAPGMIKVTVTSGPPPHFNAIQVPEVKLVLPVFPPETVMGAPECDQRRSRNCNQFQSQKEPLKV